MALRLGLFTGLRGEVIDHLPTETRRLLKGPGMNAPDSSCHDVYKVNSLTRSPDSNAVDGHVRWDPCRSLWNGGMLLGALALGPLTFTWGAFAVFVVVLGIIMCAGHSVGFHRLLIHRTFECCRSSRWRTSRARRRWRPMPATICWGRVDR